MRALSWLLWFLMLASAWGAWIEHSPALLILSVALLSAGLIVDGRRVSA